MEPPNIAFDPGRFWNEAYFGDILGDGVLNFDNLEIPELPDFALEECLQEPPQHQQPQISDHTTYETSLLDDSGIPPDLWALISAEMELSPVVPTPSMGDITSYGSPTWTSSPGRSISTQSSAGGQSAWTPPPSMNASPVLPDMHLSATPLHNMSPVPVSSYNSAPTAAAALPIMPENPEPSPVASTAHTSRQRRNTRRRQRNAPSIPARELRKQTRPAKCPICHYGHTYRADMQKHIASNHPEQADKFHVSTARTPCTMCSKTFARRDHFLRHCRTIHEGHLI